MTAPKRLLLLVAVVVTPNLVEVKLKRAEALRQLELVSNVTRYLVFDLDPSVKDLKSNVLEAVGILLVLDLVVWAYLIHQFSLNIFVLLVKFALEEEQGIFLFPLSVTNSLNKYSVLLVLDEFFGVQLDFLKSLSVDAIDVGIQLLDLV